MDEYNFQCLDCGVCFADNEEGKYFVNEHQKLTSHKGITRFKVSEILKIALKKIEAMKTVKEEFHN